MKCASPNWAVERRVFPQAEEERLIQALATHEVEYHEFEGQGFKLDATLNSVAVARGSCYYVREMSRSLGWLAKLFGQPEQFNCQSYYPAFEKNLLNRDHRVMSFGELCWTQPTLALDLGDEQGQLFIRPDDGFKTFEGALVAPADFEAWVSRQKLLQVANHIKVIVARPMILRAEWRLLMINGQAVAASEYRPKRMGNAPAEVRRFAEQAHLEAQWPLGAYSLDIAQTDIGLKIVEVGSLLCVAFYEADAEAIVAALQPLVEAAVAS